MWQKSAWKDDDGFCQSYEVTETMSKQSNQVEEKHKVKGKFYFFSQTLKASMWRKFESQGVQ